MILTVLIVFLIPFILPLLLPKKHWLRYYLWYLQTAMITTVVLILIPLRFNKKLHDEVFTFLTTLSFKLSGIKWISKNKKHFDKYNSAIVVANHQSLFDILGLVLFNKGIDGISAIVKKEVKYIPILGQIFQLGQAIFIDRNKSKESFNLMKNSIRKLQDKKIIIFPEGTRNKNTDGFLDFKFGAFRIAIELQLPIIPVVISPYLFAKSVKEFSCGEVIVSCLEPIETKNLLPEDLEDLTNKTRQLMLDEYFKLSAELGKK